MSIFTAVKLDLKFVFIRRPRGGYLYVKVCTPRKWVLSNKFVLSCESQRSAIYHCTHSLPHRFTGTHQLLPSQLDVFCFFIFLILFPFIFTLPSEFQSWETLLAYSHMLRVLQNMHLVFHVIFFVITANIVRIQKIKSDFFPSIYFPRLSAVLFIHTQYHRWTRLWFKKPVCTLSIGHSSLYVKRGSHICFATRQRSTDWPKYHQWTATMPIFNFKNEQIHWKN